MNDKNEVISDIRKLLAKASALVDKLDALDVEDIRAAGLVFCDLGELFEGLADMSAQAAALFAAATLVLGMADAE